ncbi:hypothetical protein HN51_002705 [Arachis hypogaea]|uniref:receptor-like cytosolic serine/threonine-protein kinase RBK2 n=1 Tax=Arachis hypogaea TaxID=3818 RepID=UPI000DEC9D96|nr:receptor-like cytosolic serine/threonine-protein kinase RBK2 [Arachis hypogaea]QHO50926.1 Receptor-like cytosolic serine/threonine-protein kinase [Arachis hypogaea]
MMWSAPRSALSAMALEPPPSPQPSSATSNDGLQSKQREQNEAKQRSIIRSLRRLTALSTGSLPDVEPPRSEDVSVSSMKSCPSPGSESSSSNTGSPSNSGEQSDLKGNNNNNNWNGIVSILKKGSQMPLYTLTSIKEAPYFKKRTSAERIPEEFSAILKQGSSLNPEAYRFKASWKLFTLADLQAATNNFSQENLIGQGGYGEVYKGQLADGTFVAIKRLTRGDQEEMTADFLSELGIIVHVDHPNIAKLIGYGVEGGMHLVLQLSPHGSLASILYGPREKLNWNMRYKIALGTAEGLHYLHAQCQRRIIHRDIKAANILLSEDFEPQIADFGLSKWLPDKWTHHTVSKVEGTFGYLPPEYFMHGIVDEKTDVFAYGVLLLELITGRPALDKAQKSLVMWAKPLISKSKMDELIDPCLAGAYDEEQMKYIILTASLCIAESTVRPRMHQVLQIAKGEEGSMEFVRELLEPLCDDEFLEEEFPSPESSNDISKHLQTIGQD